MQRITSFDEAHVALRHYYGKHAAGPYTLDRMREMMNYLGNPQDKLKIIHVAGTSGKTSTAYYAAALLQAAGFKVGLTVSPHVDEVNERLQINLTPLPEKEFCEALGEFIDRVAASGILPSYFELMVAFAYSEFVRQQVDYAVVEVGLGGLLDGTNVVSRPDKICVITDIGLDHTEILGNSLAEIATQKAGITQPDNEVFVYEQDKEVMDAITKAASKQQATLHVLQPESRAELSDLPGFQQRNFGLAKAAVQFVLAREGHPALQAQQLNTAAATHIPARMEILHYAGKTIIIDGAHNAQKLQTLLNAVSEKYPGQDTAALVGFAEGDTFRLERALDVLLKQVSALIVTSFYSEKDYPKHSVDPAQVIKYCADHGYKNIQSITEPAGAFTTLLDCPQQILLITGSFYLLNHVRPLLFGQA